MLRPVCLSTSQKSCLLFVVLGYFIAIGPQGAEARPTISETPLTLTFTAMEGGANPKMQTFTISNTGNRMLRWRITDDANWLKVSPPSGTTTAERDKIVVRVDITGLVANTYTGAITISTPQISSASRQIAVTLVLSPPAPMIATSPMSLSFVGTEGGANPTAQSVSITNTGKGTLNWTASDNAPWLNISPALGTTTTATDAIKVSVNTVGLTANTYTATLTLADPGSSNGSQQLPVTLILTAPDSSFAVLNWDRNAEADIAGYKLYVGTVSRSYGAPLDMGDVTTFKVINLSKGKAYFFAVTAYDAAGNESALSNEGSKTIN